MTNNATHHMECLRAHYMIQTGVIYSPKLMAEARAQFDYETHTKAIGDKLIEILYTEDDLRAAQTMALGLGILAWARDNIEEVTYSFAVNATLFTNQVMAWLRWGAGNEPPRGSVDILLQHVISEENPKSSVIREVDFLYHELLHQVTGLLIVEESK
nr:MAG TPA: hypothetical protein [Caudoviricetes sp.]